MVTLATVKPQPPQEMTGQVPLWIHLYSLSEGRQRAGFYNERVRPIICMYMQNVHANMKQSKQKRQCQAAALQTLQDWTDATFVGGEVDAGTYLHYILPAHPDHNCEKDALVRRQRGPEGSYQSLSMRWGDQIDWTQILLADYYIQSPLTGADRALQLLDLNYTGLGFACFIWNGTMKMMYEWLISQLAKSNFFMETWSWEIGEICTS